MHLMIPCILLASVLCTVTADDVILQKRVYYPSEVMEPLDPKRKKPFCNAFTGCGRKRSDDSMATLVDLNSEPAVEELSRQILSEAKLWEAIQEARLELLNRKQQFSSKMFAPAMTGKSSKISATRVFGSACNSSSLPCNNTNLSIPGRQKDSMIELWEHIFKLRVHLPVHQVVWTENATGIQETWGERYQIHPLPLTGIRKRASQYLYT